MIESCPTWEQLHDYAVGKLREDSAEQVAAHVTTCPSCDETLAQLESSSDTLLAALSEAMKTDPVLAEPQLKSALSLIEAIGTDLSSTAMAGESHAPPEPLETVGGYELLVKLGQGGMGTVYKARHTKLDRIVALKVLPADRMQNAEAVRRFDREMKAVGKLSHPNIVAAHDAGEIDGRHFLVMELVDGVDLSTLLRRLGPASGAILDRSRCEPGGKRGQPIRSIEIDPPADAGGLPSHTINVASDPASAACMTVADACELIRQAAVGLQYANSKGMVHRDIKPSNLMLARSEHSGPQVKILDMGLALLDDQTQQRDLTTTGQLMGTLDYMAPEQGTDSHSVDIRADIYSLGATLFKLLAGRTPFSSDKYNTPLKLMMAKASQDAPSLADVRDDLPDELVAIVDRMLARDPAARFATPAEVAAALAPFAEGANLAALLDCATTKDTQSIEDQSAAATHESLKCGSAETAATVDMQPSIPDKVSGGREPAGFSHEQTPPHQPADAGRSPVSAPMLTRRNRTVAIAAGLAGAAALLLGVILTLKTPHGTVQVRLGEGVSADDVQLEVIQGGRLHVIDKHNNWQIDLQDGQWNVRLKKGDDRFTVDRQTVTVHRRGKELVTVTLRDQPDATSAEDEQVRPAPPAGQSFALQFIGDRLGMRLRRDDHVTIPSLTYDTSHPLTIEAFVEPESSGTAIECVEGEANVVASLRRAGGSSSGYYWTGTHVSDRGSATVSSQEQLGVDARPGVRRSHVALVWDGQELRIYVNGKFGGRSACKPPLLAPKGRFVIGTNLQGQIDEVRISKTPRYDGDFEPADRFAADEQTLAVYHFEEGQGERLIDSSGNNHHGNIVGAVWVPSSETVDINRRAAAWVMSVGGTIYGIKAPEDIPPSPFYLDVHLEYVPAERITAEGLSLLNGTRVSRLVISVVDESAFLQLTNLPQLTDLMLMSRRATLSREGIRHITRFPTLTFLTLSNQNVRDGDLEFLCAKLPNLSWLEIPGTHVTDASVPHLARLRSLHTLYIHDTQITDAGIAPLARLPILGELWLDGTQLTARSAEYLNQCPKLSVIRLFVPERVAALRNIKLLRESIGLVVAAITDTELASLSDAVQLSRLSLGYSPSLTSAGLRHLQSLTNLTYLNLDRTSVDDEGLKYLEGMKKLRTLDLRNTKVTAAGVARLQKALPDCEIFSSVARQ